MALGEIKLELPLAFISTVYSSLSCPSWAIIGSHTIAIALPLFILSTAAAVAGTTAAAMYIDARYHLQKDLRYINGMRRGVKLYKKAAQEDRLSLYNLFEKSALQRGNEDCIWSREGCYTWSQAYNKVNQYGQWFLSLGVKPRDLVGFYLYNSPDFVLAWLGLWSIGAAPAMINHNLSGKALLHCVKMSGAKLLLVDKEPQLLARIEEVQKTFELEYGMTIIVLDAQMGAKISSLKTEKPADEYRKGIKGDQPMCLFYTSGTTGKPKACVFTVARVYERGITRQTGLTTTRDDDRCYDCMPFYHGTGGVTAVTQLMSGFTLCIGKKFSTSRFWSDIRDSRATWFIYVGETARYLLAAPPSPLDKQHNIRCMFGNGLRPDVWLKFRERFNVPEVLEFFNSTEGMLVLSNFCQGDYLATAVGHHGLLMRHLTRNLYVPVGIDRATGEIARDPATGFAIRQPYSVGGELLVAVQPAGVRAEEFPGYYKNDDETAKKLVENVFKQGDRWYRSGDALRRTDDGRWFFLDRLGDTFRWKGENVSTAEVSEVVGNFPGIVEANVYGVQLPNHDGRAGCAAIYIDPRERPNFDFAALLRHTRTHLPRYAVPPFLRLVREMTPIHNNKQNKIPLREEGIDPSKVKTGDEIWWVDAGSGGGRIDGTEDSRSLGLPHRGKTYQRFTARDWEKLCGGRARL